MDPERSHEMAMRALRVVGALPSVGRLMASRYRVEAPGLGQRVLGRWFENPVGVAAGFDKEGVGVGGLASLGFGFVEVGTVTPRAQAGNARPRLFRHAAYRSLQNALGFNSGGMVGVAARLGAGRPFGVPVGINVGKNRTTPGERAIEDYGAVIRELGPLADYVAINLSSPNTPGLRNLQNEAFVRAVLAVGAAATDRPLLVKLSPDMDPAAAAELAAVAVDAGAAGIIATNTTTDYSLVPGVREVGGLSGAVLRERSFEVMAAVARRVRGRAVVVAVGGIDSGAEAYRRMRAGASLVEVYTALVYQGPGLARRINRELVELMERDGVRQIGEVVGADVPGA
jgi:dihydroorotate dehydrogenase